MAIDRRDGGSPLAPGVVFVVGVEVPTVFVAEIPSTPPTREGTYRVTLAERTVLSFKVRADNRTTALARALDAHLGEHEALDARRRSTTFEILSTRWVAP